MTIPTPPGYKKNYVATTMMTGYKIKNRLLRSAKVGIFIWLSMIVVYLIYHSIPIFFLKSFSLLSSEGV